MQQGTYLNIKPNIFNDDLHQKVRVRVRVRCHEE